MNRLSIKERASILAMLVEGNSLRSCARLADVSLNTVSKLLVEVGRACEQFHDEHVNNVRVRRLQCDEIWSFVGAKANNVTAEKKAEGWGDTWTWIGLDADTKLCLSYLVGGRGADWAMDFVQDCASRIKGRVQLTTDGYRAYLEAVEDAFGAEIDYAMLHKVYGNAEQGPETRYSPAICTGTKRLVIAGNPDQDHISTSYVERHNLTMRMSMRRFRLTNAFSKKVQNHAAMVAIHAVHYNFARIHKTLRITPSVAAYLSEHVWSLEEIITMADKYIPKSGKGGPYKKNIISN